MVEHINPALVDRSWWPDRVDDIAASEMDLDLAGQLSSDMPKFIETVESEAYNGIVGRVRNYFDLDAALLFERMMNVARKDVRALHAD